MVKNTLAKLHRIVLLLLIIFAISAHQGKFFGYELYGEKEKNTSIEFGLVDIKEIIPKATKLERNNETTLVYNNNGQLGKVICTSPYANEIHGFGGPVPFLIIIDNNEKILGIKLLKNNETYSYIEKIKKLGFLENWNGIDAGKAVHKNVDAVSGATETSKAIIKSLQLRLSNFMQTANANNKTDLLAWTKNILFLVVLLFAVVSFLYPKKLKNYRLILLISSILVFGILNGKMLSTGMFYSWIVNGVSLSSKVLIIALVLLSVILPVATNKSFYCQYLCPFGACQEVLGKVNPKKVALPEKLQVFLAVLRLKIFAVVIFLLVVNIGIDFSVLEPFTIFSLQNAPLVAVIVALFFLTLSIFINKPWCKYFCPTGQVLEIFKTKKTKFK